MGRLGVTYDAVASAASKIEQQGFNPTVDRIREILKTGSKNTLLNHLRKWRSLKGGEVISPSLLPPELLKLINNYYIKLQSNTSKHNFEIEIAALKSKLDLFKKDVFQLYEQLRIHK